MQSIVETQAPAQAPSRVYPPPGDDAPAPFNPNRPPAFKLPAPPPARVTLHDVDEAEKYLEAQMRGHAENPRRVGKMHVDHARQALATIRQKLDTQTRTDYHQEGTTWADYREARAKGEYTRAAAQWTAAAAAAMSGNPQRKWEADRAHIVMEEARRHLVTCIEERLYNATANPRAELVSGTKRELRERINRAAMIVTARSIRPAYASPHTPELVAIATSHDPRRRTAAPEHYEISRDADGRHRCTCPDYAHRAPETLRGRWCKHILAAKIYSDVEAPRSCAPVFTTAPPDVRRIRGRHETPQSPHPRPRPPAQIARPTSLFSAMDGTAHGRGEKTP